MQRLDQLVCLSQLLYRQLKIPLRRLGRAADIDVFICDLGDIALEGIGPKGCQFAVKTIEPLIQQSVGIQLFLVARFAALIEIVFTGLSALISCCANWAPLIPEIIFNSS